MVAEAAVVTVLLLEAVVAYRLYRGARRAEASAVRFFADTPAPVLAALRPSDRSPA